MRLVTYSVNGHNQIHLNPSFPVSEDMARKELINMVFAKSLVDDRWTPSLAEWLVKVEPAMGLEPTTYGLQNRCSAN